MGGGAEADHVEGVDVVAEHEVEVAVVAHCLCVLWDGELGVGSLRARG